MGMHPDTPGELLTQTQSAPDPEVVSDYEVRVAGIILAATGVDHSESSAATLSAIYEGGLNISDEDPFASVKPKKRRPATATPFVASEHALEALEAIVKEGGVNAPAAARELAKVEAQISFLK